MTSERTGREHKQRTNSSGSSGGRGSSKEATEKATSRTIAFHTTLLLSFAVNQPTCCTADDSHSLPLTPASHSFLRHSTLVLILSLRSSSLPTLRSPPALWQFFLYSSSFHRSPPPQQ